ncbi:MAG TPA: hypothetical protein VMV19_13895 [Xanthobacteraceae bacterium]|nr:hypothetical protein [Xanthobacteraceae bacterium]
MPNQDTVPQQVTNTQQVTNSLGLEHSASLAPPSTPSPGLATAPLPSPGLAPPLQYLRNEALAESESGFAFKRIVDEICDLNWRALDRENLAAVAAVYYYFSVQFRETLEIACRLYPSDKLLQELDAGERNTANLSPWPGVADEGERMNHDEFMRRTLRLTPVQDSTKQRLAALGSTYLAKSRGTDSLTRAISLASYEDGGLEKVFRSILQARDWDDPLLRAFRHFLIKHIEFDSDPEHGHGVICRHLTPDDSIAPLWSAFRDMLVAAAPKLTDACG